MLNLKNLWERSQTATIFGVVVILLLNYNSISIFIFLLLVSFLTAFEYVKMNIPKIKYGNSIIIAIAGGSLPLLFEYFFHFLNNISFITLLSITIIYFIYLIIILFSKKLGGSRLNYLTLLMEILLFIGVPFMLYLYASANYLSGFKSILFILIIFIWINDTFAYLLGSSFGKHKLMPSVSPKKSIEGFIGGGVFTIISSFAIYHFYNYFNFWFYLFLSIIVFILGTIGDLIESRMKRIQKVKDSGTMLPGHGGFLDRFDSFIFTLPFLILLIHLFSK
jgi:phosphatidate cytidylyltransferase